MIQLIKSENEEISEVSGYKFNRFGLKLPPNVESGFIQHYNQEKEFGFVKTKINPGGVFFHVNVYQKMLKGTPHVKEKVKIITDVNPKTKKARVIDFVVPSGLECQENHFEDFIFPDANELFLAYIYEGEIQELKRADLKQLPMAVAYYKSGNRQDRFLLEAVETMIHRGFSDTKITQKILRSQRIELLNKLIADAKEKKLPWLFSEYQSRLQRLKYAPRQLQSFGREAALIEIDDIQICPLEEAGSPWAFSLPNVEIAELPRMKRWEINPDEPIPAVEPLALNESWETDLRDYEVKLPASRPDTYYDIRL